MYYQANAVESLSARRAWIEIVNTADKEARKRVALRKESVDRNPYVPLAKVRHCESLSARRAWIEISSCALVVPSLVVVSLSARRAWIEIVHRGPDHFYLGGRSPQGERG